VSWAAFALFCLALALFAAATAQLLGGAFGRGPERAAQRLRGLARERWSGRGPAAADGASILREADSGLAGRLARLRGGRILERANRLLGQADLPGAGRFALLSAGCAALGFWLASARAGLFPSLAAAAAGAALPWIYALQRKRRRMRELERQLPEALDLLCRSLRAGHALSSGIQLISEELEDPIRREFAQVASEIALGLETRQALANLCQRVDVPDLGFFSTAILIQRETGGNLAEIMQRLAHVIRERHKFYGKVSAMTAQNRGAALILLCAPPGFVLMMRRASPEFVAPLFETQPGQLLALIAGAMTLAGYLIARRLAVVKV